MRFGLRQEGMNGRPARSDYLEVLRCHYLEVRNCHSEVLSHYSEVRTIRWTNIRWWA